MEEKSVSASTFYITLLGHLHDLSEDLTYLCKISYSHVANNHRKLTFVQLKELFLIEENIIKIFKKKNQAFSSNKALNEFEEILIVKNEALRLSSRKLILKLRELDKRR